MGGYDNIIEKRSLPSAEHAEVTILGACLLDGIAINDALEILEADDFLTDSHKRIYASVVRLTEAGKGVDLITVSDELSLRKELESVGGLPYLSFLTEGIPRHPNILDYVAIVRDKSQLRRLMRLCDEGMLRASDHSEKSEVVIASLEEQIIDIAQRGERKGFTTLTDEIKAAGGFEEYVSKMTDPVAMTGLSIGYKDLDDLLGGLQRQELTIIAARPSMGKTAWAINIAQNVALETGNVVAVFSLEMSKKSLFQRMHASMAYVNPKRAIQGFLSAEEKRRFASAVIQLGHAEFHVDDTAELTVTQMRARCRRLKQMKGRLDLIVVDYLQLMRGVGKHGNRQEEVSSISRGLKAVSKALDVPVVALSQLSRATEQRGGNKRPLLSDLRESGSIEQDADVVMFIHREEYYHAEDDPDVERGVAEIITAKNRNGPVGTRKLAYNAGLTRFDNLVIEER